MKLNDVGLKVADFQAQLRWTGIDIIPNGVYDEHTEKMVKEFQSDNGLTSDGWAGKKTQAKLDSLTKDAWLYLFIHCSATREGHDLGKDWIINLHCNKKGWSRPGYSDCIRLDGSLESLRSFDTDDLIGDWEYTFGVKGSTMMNRNSRHVVYIGGVEKKNWKIAKDTRTDAQKKTLELYIRFMLLRNPRLIIVGHNQVQKKDCPSFDTTTWLMSLGIPTGNIAHWGKQHAI